MRECGREGSEDLKRWKWMGAQEEWLRKGTGEARGILDRDGNWSQLNPSNPSINSLQT